MLKAAAWQRVLKRDGLQCHYCGRDDILLVQEHQIPLSRGGEDSVENVVPACMSCNSSKSDRTPEEFTAYLADKAAERERKARETGRNIGVNIRRVREERAYDQAELAREAGLSASTLWRIEHGEREPRGKTLRAIAGVLGVGIAELRGEIAQ